MDIFGCHYLANHSDLLSRTSLTEIFKLTDLIPPAGSGSLLFCLIFLHGIYHHLTQCIFKMCLSRMRPGVLSLQSPAV